MKKIPVAKTFVGMNIWCSILVGTIFPKTAFPYMCAQESVRVYHIFHAEQRNTIRCYVYFVHHKDVYVWGSGALQKMCALKCYNEP